MMPLRLMRSLCRPQIVIDSETLLILGGCGGPNAVSICCVMSGRSTCISAPRQTVDEKTECLLMTEIYKSVCVCVQLLKDAWLLHMSASSWTWQQLRVENEDHGAPELWCHPACKVSETSCV